MTMDVCDVIHGEENGLDTVVKTIPDFHSLIVIDKIGNLMSYFVSEQCADGSCLSTLKEIARLTSIRFKIGEFHKTLGGLELTINMFEKYFSLVRTVFRDNYLVVIVPRETNFLLDSISIVQKLEGSLLLHQKCRMDPLKKPQNNNGIRRVSSEPTSVEKDVEKLTPGRYYIAKDTNFKTESEHWKSSVL